MPASAAAICSTCSTVLPMPENHFGHAVPQSPVMVHFREPKIFKRHMPQLIECCVNRCRALANLLEQVLYLLW